MLIIFIIAFVAFIAICDFSAFFFDADLLGAEDILQKIIEESTVV